MEPEKLLEALHTAEKLKDTTRHCYTSKGRHESVAEHSWRIALMAFWRKPFQTKAWAALRVRRLNPRCDG